MNLKLITSLLLCFLSFAAFAQKNQPISFQTSTKVTLAQEKLISNAFLYLNQFWADKGQSLSRTETEKYFTPDTSLIINGKTVYTGYVQFDHHFKEVGKHIIGKIRFPLLEIMNADNKLIVHFNEDIRDNNGSFYPTNVIAIFTLYNGRIQKWEEVVNSSYFCQSEYEKVVYSK